MQIQHEGITISINDNKLISKILAQVLGTKGTTTELPKPLTLGGKPFVRRKRTNYRAWTPDEMQRLRELYSLLEQGRISWKAISRELHRTPRNLYNKVWRMGLRTAAKSHREALPNSEQFSDQ